MLHQPRLLRHERKSVTLKVEHGVRMDYKKGYIDQWRIAAEHFHAGMNDKVPSIMLEVCSSDTSTLIQT